MKFDSLTKHSYLLIFVLLTIPLFFYGNKIVNQSQRDENEITAFESIFFHASTTLVATDID